MKPKLFIVVLSLALVLAGHIHASQTKSQNKPLNMAVASDKYDGDCTGKETVGRCADKPYPPHTPTGCPYGDSIPVDSPKCAPPAATIEPVELPPMVDMVGK